MTATTSTNADDNFADFLQPYAAPIPPAFSAALQQQLLAIQPRPTKIRWAILTSALAAAVALAFLWSHFFPHQINTAPQITQIPAPKNLADTRPTGTSMMLGLLTLETQMSRAPLIVRTRITKITGWSVEFTLLHTIYGHTENKSFTFDVTYHSPTLAQSYEDRAREQLHKDGNENPTPNEIHAAALNQNGYVLNHEVILMLNPSPAGPTPPAAPATPRDFQTLGMQFDAPPSRSLDAAEKEMMRVIEAGSFLEPCASTGDVFQPQVNAAHAIVRAKLLEVTPTHARWQITRTLKGAIETPELLIDHDTFKARAEALINYAALSNQSLRTDPARAAAIQAKTASLIQQDLRLKPDQSAILFLGQPTRDPQPATTTRATLQLIAHEDPDNKNKLDQLEDAISTVSKIPTRL